jgi:hypothetical protein
LLFDQIVKMDLEGIVCKGKDSPYKATEKPSRHWILLPGSVAADRTTPALRDGPNDTGDHQPQTHQAQSEASHHDYDHHHTASQLNRFPLSSGPAQCPMALSCQIV